MARAARSGKKHKAFFSARDPCETKPFFRLRQKGFSVAALPQDSSKEVNQLSANLEAKKLIVDEIKQKIADSKSVVFVDYKGLTVAEVSELRNKFRAAGAEYKVYKNTLLRKAFNELGVTAFDEALNGPTATAFSKDEVTAAKLLVEAAKATIRISIRNQMRVLWTMRNVDANGVTALASMPSREELIAKMLGSMQAPLANFAGVLTQLLRGVVVALGAIAERRAHNTQGNRCP